MSLRIIRSAAQAPLAPLQGATIAVLGYGNQGHAHALNLRDSGLEVVVGCRPDSAAAQAATAANFQVLSYREATARGDLVIVALPDERHQQMYEEEIAPGLKPGSTLGFLHGFSIRFGQIKPPAEVGVVMVAPKGPGATLRSRFTSGHGLACLFAVHQAAPEGNDEARGLAWAAGIGSARSGIIYTTFADEAETDLFGEQAVLCGGLWALMTTAFETLIEQGYPAELAYIECCQEVKQIGDLVFERGIAGMMEAISNTAEFGAYRAGAGLVDEHVRAVMRQTLTDIRNGTFAQDMRDDYERGFPWFEKQRRALADHPLEQTGHLIRDLTVPKEGEDTQSPQGNGR
jgi:ketol-acid reductoisomerase